MIILILRNNYEYFFKLLILFNTFLHFKIFKIELTFEQSKASMPDKAHLLGVKMS